MKTPILLSIAALVLSVQACDSSGADPQAAQTISKEAFTQAYIALRMEALRTSRQGEMILQYRDSILESMGLEPEDLLHFAEVWGQDGEMMNEVWQEVDSVIRGERVAASDDDYEEGDLIEMDSNQREAERGGGGTP